MSKRAHLPTMSPVQIRNNRCVLAYWLGTEAKATIPDIRAILKCSGPDEVRRLKARGAQLAVKILAQEANEAYERLQVALHRPAQVRSNPLRIAGCLAPWERPGK